jgi:RNA polymerase sigma-70 factor, ECF subfamily
MKLYDLLEKSRKGDVRAFNELIVSTMPVIRSTVNKFFSGDMAEDAMQETSIKIWKSLHTFDFTKTSSVRSWIKRITANCCIDLKRYESRRNADQFDSLIQFDSDDDQVVFIDIPCAEKNPEQIIYESESIEYLLSVLGKHLSEKQRTLVCEMHIEGKSQKEIAEEYSLSPGNVGAIICRAMNILKAAMQNHAAFCHKSCTVH